MNNRVVGVVLGAVVLTMIFTGCQSSSKANLSGNVAGAEGEVIYLQRFVNNSPVVTDSAVIDNNGKFTLQPSQPLELNFYKLQLADDQFVVLIMDSTENVHLETTKDKFEPDAVISGSPNSQLLLDFHRSMVGVGDELRELKAKSTDAGISEEERSQNYSKFIAKSREKHDLAKEFVDNNISSPAVLAALSELNIKQDLDRFKKVSSSLAQSFGHTYYYKMVNEQIKNSKKQTQARPPSNSKYGEGDSAPNIKMNDPMGQTRSLDDLRGKVVMLDFWASWCGPCRRENPAVVQAYNKYNKDGFEVFSVSLDKDKAKWQRAIEQDGLIWENHVSDLKGWQNTAAQAYGISSIPHTLLIDRNGKIIATHLRGGTLQAKLQEIFGH